MVGVAGVVVAGAGMGCIRMVGGPAWRVLAVSLGFLTR